MSFEELFKDYQNLQKKYDEKDIELQNTNIELENTKLELNNLKKIIYGVKREHTPKNEQIVENRQCSLFDDNEKEQDEEIQKQIKENVEEITVYRKKKSKKKKAGIKKEQLKNIEVEIIEYKINKDEKCPICNSELLDVGKKIVNKEIVFVPAKFVIKQHVQYTYKCSECGGKNSDNASFEFVKTQPPKPVLTHSFASASLATEVIYQKYYLGVPLYRQEKMWEDKGLVLPRNMMANWNIKMNEYYFGYLYDLMFKQLKENNELAHTDETTIQCNKEVGRKASSNSYMWVFRSGELEEIKGTIFKYYPSRSAKTAEEFLSGFNGILVTDGFASYNNIDKVTHAECWAHTRRYFLESIPLDENKKPDINALGHIGLTYCNELFKIEREIADLSEDEKLKKRQEKSKPILEEFFKWVSSTISNKVILNKKLNKALTYAINQEKELSEFISDGRIPLSNSLAERSIRPFAVHRKNWLFADSVAGANTNAVMYSIVESAKANNLNIWKYINYLLENLPQLEDITDEKALEKYLPWSKQLPEEILNFQGTYEELKVE